MVKPRKTKHQGESMYPEHRVWTSMRNRCTSPLSPAWKNYGGRGIKVCDRWLRSFEDFLADMGRRPGRGYEIDRIDNDGDYEPGNCRWASQKENSRNRRSARIVEFRGRRMCLSEACELVGMPYSTVLSRLSGGWTVAVALATPVREKAEKGKAKSLATPKQENKHGFKGVKVTASGRFKGRRIVNGKRVETATFETPEEAFAAYEQLGKKSEGPRGVRGGSGGAGSGV